MAKKVQATTKYIKCVAQARTDAITEQLQSKLF